MKRYFTRLMILFCLVSAPVLAQDVGLAGIMGSKAMLMINGGEPRTVAVGQSIDGIKLVSIQGDQVVVEIGGKKRPLRVGQHAVGAASSGDGSGQVSLTADGRGHFVTTGQINGTSLKFLVDTGATSIAIGASDARRIGLDTTRGERFPVSTANGRTTAIRVKLDTVRIGDITLHGIDAAVMEHDMEPALLGMTFLNRMEMQRNGATMTLKKRF